MCIICLSYLYIFYIYISFLKYITYMYIIFTLFFIYYTYYIYYIYYIKKINTYVYVWYKCVYTLISYLLLASFFLLLLPSCAWCSSTANSWVLGNLLLKHQSKLLPKHPTTEYHGNPSLPKLDFHLEGSIHYGNSPKMNQLFIRSWTSLAAGSSNRSPCSRLCKQPTNTSDMIQLIQIPPIPNLTAYIGKTKNYEMSRLSFPSPPKRKTCISMYLCQAFQDLCCSKHFLDTRSKAANKINKCVESYSQVINPQSNVVMFQNP